MGFASGRFRDLLPVRIIPGLLMDRDLLQSKENFALISFLALYLGLSASRDRAHCARRCDSEYFCCHLDLIRIIF
jgi:hypothetical protein